MSKLIIVRGLPGSGKSTFANSLGCFHVENDYYHVRNGSYKFVEDSKFSSFEWCMNIAEDALSNGIDVVVSNTFVKNASIDSYRRLARIYNAELTVYCMKGSFGNKHNVPSNVKKNMEEKWEAVDGEVFVYPNTKQDPSDPCYRPYMFTNLNVGDHVLARRWAYGVHLVVLGEEVEHEEAEAVVTEIRQGTYDYLNVFYKFIDTGDESLAMSGDLKKLEKKAYASSK